jgi:hypothetical protein
MLARTIYIHFHSSTVTGKDHIAVKLCSVHTRQFIESSHQPDAASLIIVLCLLHGCKGIVNLLHFACLYSDKNCTFLFTTEKYNFYCVPDNQ